ncbi:sensor histidine kinase [Dulcicalothrix desertica PCC 7102]|uniref:histidine kinase n=1 Tax=Dulcicalothrix desertica PCC 7102 TaxID=232991 RepID=A0A433VQ32_9CYAN|nr:HAMP domain-containing sensor histidine kinase [Dulcicalothrix desertica]RUT08132.1 sensor histidine kinase [Dulcicalothrix desertica PCC 7102]TWH40001.1 histidine kinase/DNA gyrase B/HSP90-like ATPase [Dulcicalothrix desertica PCC 7102]
MTISFSLETPKNDFHLKKAPNVESVRSFVELQAEQLVSQGTICFARIVYYDSVSKSHEEVICYADNQPSFSQKDIAYIRSETWLTDFPHVWDVSEFKLAHPTESFTYVCPIGYKNQKPEYIQIVTHKPLSLQLQNYVRNAAKILGKYIDVYSEKLQHKYQIQLLEHVLHKVGHQLRNYIALIKLYAQNLLIGLQDSSYIEQAKVICESVEDLDANLTDIISCGQGTILKITSQDLRSLVDESIKSFQPLINDKKLKVHVPQTSATLPLDRLQMKQVFDNLLGNAIHFSYENGVITFSWQVFHEEILIKILDEGPGVSQEDMQKMFTPFYSRRPGGTGLGLTIAKKIVLDHYGNIWAHSVSGGGTQFSIILPTKKN